MGKKRLVYIDNLRIFLISLVVLLHLAITYGAPGDWYYVEAEITDLSVVPLSMFNATNQAFFMGLFFFISAFFTVHSLRKKGVVLFIRDRLVRLGIPLAFFYFILSPLTVFLLVRFVDGRSMTAVEFLRDIGGFGWGPMWFVEALLMFTAVFLLLHLVTNRRDEVQRPPRRIPGDLAIVTTAIAVGILQFLIRIQWPVGWAFEPLGFQFPHFVQYIVMFSFGIVAARNDWFAQLDQKRAMRWFIASQVIIFVGFPAVFVTGGAMDGNLDPFMGGLHWQSLGYALWEQLVGFSLSIGLLGIFKRYLGGATKLTQELSASAYTVYIIHAPVAVGLAILLSGWQVYPLLKFTLVGPVIVAACFVLAGMIRRIPGLSHIL